MPYSSIDRETWDDAWIRGLLKEGPSGQVACLLFFYCFTNSHMNLAGIYQVGLDTVALESGFADGAEGERFTAAIERIRSRVVYSAKDGVLWVRNYIRNQRGAKNDPNYLLGVARVLEDLGPITPVRRMIEWNERHGIAIAKLLPGVYRGRGRVPPGPPPGRGRAGVGGTVPPTKGVSPLPSSPTPTPHRGSKVEKSPEKKTAKAKNRQNPDAAAKRLDALRTMRERDPEEWANIPRERREGLERELAEEADSEGARR